MDLVERYVNAVRTYLPREQQNDIADELSANIQAQIDDLEDELGRPLTDGELETILRHYGNPMLVAGRYQQHQGGVVFGRQLIGAMLFPFYLRALWFVLGISLVIVLLIFVALNATGTQLTIGGTVNILILQAVIQFAVVTAIFAVFEHMMPTLPWDVRQLPSWQVKVRQSPQVSRLESVAQIVGIVVVMFWLGLILSRLSLLLGPASSTYHLGPIWYQLVLPVALIFLASIVQAAINLIRPDWSNLPYFVRLGTDLAFVALLVVLLRAGGWIVFAHPSDGAAGLATINSYISIGIWCFLIGCAIVTVIDVWKFTRRVQSKES